MDTIDEILTLVTFSHTDYKDIWPIVCDGVKNIVGFKKIFATNNYELSSSVLDVYDSIIEYDDTRTYPQKIIHILESVKTPYVLFIHDIDILIKLDTHCLSDLITLIVSNSIDRCSLGAFNAQDHVLDNGSVSITNINKPNISSNWYTPYDVGPSIWKVTTFHDTMTYFKTQTYRTIETSPIQKYLQNKKIYGITSNKHCTIINQIGRIFSTKFICLHLLVRGQWLHSKYYLDLESQFKNIIAKHNIQIHERGVIETPHLQC